MKMITKRANKQLGIAFRWKLARPPTFRWTAWRWLMSRSRRRARRWSRLATLEALCASRPAGEESSRGPVEINVMRLLSGQYLFTHDKNRDEASNCCVPVAVRAGLADQNRVEDEVTETQFYSTFFLLYFLLLSLLFCEPGRSRHCSVLRWAILIVGLHFDLSLLHSLTTRAVPVLIETGWFWKLKMLLLSFCSKNPTLPSALSPLAPTCLDAWPCRSSGEVAMKYKIVDE